MSDKTDRVQTLTITLEDLANMRNDLEMERGYSKEAKRLDTICGKLYELICMMEGKEN